jgi:uridylate kinase
MKATNVDGVYDCDPVKNSAAVKFDELSYDEVLARHLNIMDTTATSLSMDNNIPIIVFALKNGENIKRVILGERIGTIVRKEEMK